MNSCRKRKKFKLCDTTAAPEAKNGHIWCKLSRQFTQRLKKSQESSAELHAIYLSQTSEPFVRDDVSDEMVVL